jgi:hypothetical protein
MKVAQIGERRRGGASSPDVYSSSMITSTAVGTSHLVLVVYRSNSRA